MPVTIGQVIMAVRNKIPDNPPTLPAPPASAFSLTPTTGGSLASGLYYFVCTWLTPYGETLPSQEISLTVPANGLINVSFSLFGGATALRVYLTGPNAGISTEYVFIQLSIAPGVISQFPVSGGTPPTRSTAYFADSDGPQFGASTLYSWLNDGLNKLSHAVEGLLDYCGVPTVSGQPMYVIPGQWLTISDVWYGGYWVQGGSRSYFYRRNAVTSDVLSNVTISITTDKQVMEVSYQPDRTSGLTSTTGTLFNNATSVAISDPSVFLLPFGFAQLGPDPVTGAVERVAYSNLNGGFMSGLIRGIGNTVAQQWLPGTLVTELSLFWCGKRIFSSDTYAPGQSLIAMPIPEGWSTILQLYMLGQAKKAEQDMQAGAALEKQSFEEAQKWMYGNRGVMQRVQVGGAPTTVVYDWTPAGGIIIP